MTVKEALEILWFGDQRYFFYEIDDAEKVVKQALEELEKKNELLTKIKDILALNYSYQEIGIKIEKLFKEELK